jgi:hypothetical protein
MVESVVSPGGPSAPAWGFFIAISTGILAIIGQQLKARYDAKLAKLAAEAAAKNARQAAENTANVSNGFVDRVDRKLDKIGTVLASFDEDFRNHLEWHINNPPQKKEEK